MGYYCPNLPKDQLSELTQFTGYRTKLASRFSLYISYCKEIKENFKGFDDYDCEEDESKMEKKEQYVIAE